MLGDSSAPPPTSPTPADNGSSSSATATATATPAMANLSPEQLIQLCMTTIQAQAQALQNLQNAPAPVTTQLPPFTAVSVPSYDEGSLSTFDSQASSSKDYPSFAALLTPLMLYFRILTQFAVSGGNLDAVAALTYGLFAYIEHLSSLNHRYEWSAVLQYHMAFHGLRRRDMVNGIYDSWGKSEPELMTQFLWGHERVKRSSPSTSTSSSAQKAKKGPIEQQMCFAFNKGSCTTSPCPRIHKCSTCNSKDHGASGCSKKDT
ncbi:hypothetical protein PM082_014589 [Marasmius tenuissimus]|nr:hypothetical protein PM082_014589 [Marasmius tenuissimus]